MVGSHCRVVRVVGSSLCFCGKGLVPSGKIAETTINNCTILVASECAKPNTTSS
jgi:hypothetical protein